MAILKIKKGDFVELIYNVSNPGESKPFDALESPIKVGIGLNQVIPGFEKALIGKKEGDKFSVEVSSDEGYGDVREDLFIKMPKDRLPQDVYVGQELLADMGANGQISILVEDIAEDFILVNANHPYAGCNLVFGIEILKVHREVKLVEKKTAKKTVVKKPVKKTTTKKVTKKK
jgi:FKBP-type peptidyl-prolyl cis-trans isomerase 2